MSCSSCNSQTHNTGSSSCDTLVTLDYVPGTACTIGVTYENKTSTLELAEAINGCESQTELSYNSDECRFEYKNEQYISSGGQEGFLQTIPVSRIAACLSLSDLADFGGSAPSNCDLLVYRTSGDCGEGCSSIDDAWQAYTPGVVDSLSQVAGFSANGCLVKLEDPSPNDNNLGCFVLTHSGNSSGWRQIQSAGVADRSNLVFTNAQGCLVKGTLPTNWGICDVSLPMPAVGAGFGRGSLGRSSGNVVIGQLNLPDYGCPYKVKLDLKGYVDMLPHVNGGHPGHINVRVGLDAPGNIILNADNWHDTSTVNTVNGWSNSASDTGVIGVNGAHTLFISIMTDVSPAFTAAYQNLVVSAILTGIVTRQ